MLLSQPVATGANATHRTVRAQALHYLARPHSHVPQAPVHTEAAWRRDDVQNEDAWTDTLSADTIAALEPELRAVASRPLHTLSGRDIPLAVLQDAVVRWRDVLIRGRGFVRIRGVPVQAWPLAWVERLYWALGQHLGLPGAQNGDGELLGHVRDLRLGKDGDVRQYMTSEAISFHCDAADVVGLLCLKTAREGGRSRIASSVAVFNALLEQHPQLAPLLFEPFDVDARSDGGTDVFRVRPAAYHAGRLRTFYHSEYIRTASRHAGVASLSAKQLQLLDAYDALASSPEHCIEMDLIPGDIQLISNHTVVHSRTAYVDHDDPSLRRHLLRLWLTIEAPDSARERWLRFRSKAEIGIALARRSWQRRR